ncbi:dienelactone hydrolase [Agrobacterium rhizogenes]|uniref:Dienelactone hydrolase domain-containing protein n=1 Tax=Rhizobium rhizogenes NBRC 13257 TaxID=1220581 RepID=A0AA87QFA6_RHIRH|nr:dienelactone hydrolase family protein [Rhizobium rhizogenes]NTF59614.1 dienelactone hydrolase [Rhizobium rhizogenes]NTF65909.1 dienelactone hydrolase [Rhizobium rhizogenes]NTF79174.1 dienelactone hydrolase [Rhizobium rhizogenes]NTG04826.1 dienelactone hydrolase [Rhizobium rhizogenes]NTG32156.1 dienelactone hydrolase [Rhizobium rhizogenes]
MAHTNLSSDDPLNDFIARVYSINDVEKRVLIAGHGPAVIVMTEMPGISPQVARFSRWVRDAGFTVYLPSLFGRDGAVLSAEEGVKVFQRACVSAEFRAFAGNGSSPITRWLKGLARKAHDECGGPGVGAIGMCFTGNFALSMMLEPSVLAPVLCQPSLPLDQPDAVESSPEELKLVRDRLEREDLTVLAYRFEGDQICRAARFAAYADALGSQFLATTLPDGAANRDVAPFFAKHVLYPHSTVTQHLIDGTGEPTIAARDEIIEFFQMRLAKV